MLNEVKNFSSDSLLEAFTELLQNSPVAGQSNGQVLTVYVADTVKNAHAEIFIRCDSVRFAYVDHIAQNGLSCSVADAFDCVTENVDAPFTFFVNPAKFAEIYFTVKKYLPTAETVQLVTRHTGRNTIANVTRRNSRATRRTAQRITRK